MSIAYKDDSSGEYARSKNLILSSVSNCKRNETLEHLMVIMKDFKEASEEVENGIYDPINEFAKHILNTYEIIKK